MTFYNLAIVEDDGIGLKLIVECQTLQEMPRGVERGAIRPTCHLSGPTASPPTPGPG